MMHGQGTYKWQDGRMYHGAYENDKKNGFGVYVWADGRVTLAIGHKESKTQRVHILPNGTVRKGL